MGWIGSKPFGVFGPLLGDELEWRQPAQCIQTARLVVGPDEVVEIGPQLFVRTVVVSLDSGFLDRPVHLLNLPIRPGVTWLGQSMFDAVLVADAIKGMVEGVEALGPIGELDAVIREHSMNGVRDGFD